MPIRKIIEIDRDKCNGCGECTTACAEGALELDEEGKAVLVRDIYYGGLGACLDVCPTGTLKIVKKNSHLLIAGDCTAFSMGGFHSELLQGKKLIIACPKLDDTGPYVEKLTALFENCHIQSLTVATMAAPCCSGLELMVEDALEKSGENHLLIKLKSESKER